jgi:hypothetical protein
MHIATETGKTVEQVGLSDCDYYQHEFWARALQRWWCELLENPIVMQIAAETGKTVEQVGW